MKWLSILVLAIAIGAAVAAALRFRTSTSDEGARPIFRVRFGTEYRQGKVEVGKHATTSGSAFGRLLEGNAAVGVAEDALAPLAANATERCSTSFAVMLTKCDDLAEKG